MEDYEHEHGTEEKLHSKCFFCGEARPGLQRESHSQNRSVHVAASQTTQDLPQDQHQCLLGSNAALAAQHEAKRHRWV
eukprot:CAMPEP_0115306856 /NCGR_PEP_ID=MMETSP0270-20121206/72820_1 /TAXON_ID=71861 /ORGANISM="Scrippsiella trochoidea, Strain CCMP3099" /LENGTH=77 /DNA_ID=CAMNT_0002725239 /DNA_START=401 /DNA_END=634 /DNA_ORIENTATION=-